MPSSWPQPAVLENLLLQQPSTTTDGKTVTNDTDGKSATATTAST
eukprot:CAMPEP_0172406084 /NCGR_PEP_ID=MMETSP1061-20121228/69305_1 /TAXON_ID=37318 /ORGANISM="Pseudo-nitzschia pungens, Strain cf. pungens" /LENGTH=44 /DNA_ID= /DNA_START= /DNA_END= /DNA_ORIENTATION=